MIVLSDARASRPHPGKRNLLMITKAAKPVMADYAQKAWPANLQYTNTNPTARIIIEMV